ncbi:hypothetical protein [Paraburkholderia oxyphila]|uniref:hypothetical protein n=1 Tax=Paraburkholderia oxyphila TaxID=614212 RepID=UPI0012EE7891|nr:hypothetical protein [Paraburkholderia oxyphila]
MRGIDRPPGKLKRLRGAPLTSGRAGTNSTVIEVSMQIEAQQRLEERPEHRLAARANAAARQRRSITKLLLSFVTAAE